MSDTTRVWLLGDSIRMSYQPRVGELLEGKAEVVGPADNGQFSLYTLSSIDRWLPEIGQPDIIHWNNGLHDVGHNPVRSPVQIPLVDYRRNLEILLGRLLGMASHVIWATTTPVHPDMPFLDTTWGWRNEEIDEYNAAARELMKSRNVPINDLHALVWSHVDEYLGEDQLHLSEAGVEACAQAVADVITPRLPST